MSALADFIALCKARLAHLDAMAADAVRTGDVDGLTRIEADKADTQATLATLEAL
jgi:hypothetical protein